MYGPSPALRTERPTLTPRGALTAPRGSTSSSNSSDLSAEQQAQIAAQREAFDYDAAERAEIMREHEVLEALLMAQLKNDASRTIATRQALIDATRRAAAKATEHIKEGMAD